MLKKFEWLFEQLRTRERIAVIIDEAQGLRDDTLEELRLFSNYAQSGKGHLEILLVGQPELLKRLMSPSLRQFHQRIGASSSIESVATRRALEYVEFKLRASGGSAKKIFAKRALAELVDHSQGIPRQINLLCNNALIRPYGADLPWVTMTVPQAAIKEYENLAGIYQEFRQPLGRSALHSAIARPAFAITGLGLVLVRLYSLGVRIPDIGLTHRAENRSVASANAGQYADVFVDNPYRIAAAEDPEPRRLQRGNPAIAALSLPASQRVDGEAANAARQRFFSDGEINTARPGIEPGS